MKPLPDATLPLDNAAHERFAQLVAEGQSQSSAYRVVYPKSQRWKAEALYAQASALARKVSVRIDAIKKATADERIMSLTERNLFLSDVCRMGQKAITETDRDMLAMDKVRVALTAAKELNEVQGSYPTDKKHEQASVVFNIMFRNGPLVREPIKTITVDDARNAERQRLGLSGTGKTD